MTDESLIDEMRSTLRADRERAENRWRATHAEAPVEAPAERVNPARPGLLARLRLRRRRA